LNWHPITFLYFFMIFLIIIKLIKRQFTILKISNIILKPKVTNLCNACILLVMHEASLDGLTLLSMMMLEALLFLMCSGMYIRRCSGWASLDFFLFLALGFALDLSKIKCVISVCIYINFDLHSFDCYLFCF